MKSAFLPSTTFLCWLPRAVTLCMLNALWLIAGSPCRADSPQQLLDLPYVEGGVAAQRLDLFLPLKSATPAPLLVWIHGGGWRGGDKRGHPLREFAEQGYAIASINYRLTREAPFPAQIDDVRAALKWLRAHAAEHGYDPQRMGVIGHSAGGHLSALFGVTAKADETVQAVCVLSGPSDMTRMAEIASDPKRRGPLEELFGKPLEDKAALIRSASPIAQITPAAPPFLILHGAKDEIVPAELAQRFSDALDAAATRKPQLVILPEITHDIFKSTRWAEEASAFFRQHLHP